MRAKIYKILNKYKDFGIYPSETETEVIYKEDFKKIVDDMEKLIKKHWY